MCGHQRKSGNWRMWCKKSCLRSSMLRLEIGMLHFHPISFIPYHHFHSSFPQSNQASLPSFTTPLANPIPIQLPNHNATRTLRDNLRRHEPQLPTHRQARFHPDLPAGPHSRDEAGYLRGVADEVGEGVWCAWHRSDCEL